MLVYYYKQRTVRRLSIIYFFNEKISWLTKKFVYLCCVILKLWKN